ncbi:U-box domain-containing protein 13 [Capsicum annuum]|uniref:U-box domain-containing protein 13 n=1 Tax=Capsicum annuum TaxID=4072 RepID=UPI0007BF4234|nr:U-box domain-containing protein 13 [Capsicum annuum]
MQLSAGRQPRHHQCRFTIATNTLLIEPSQRLDRRVADQRRPIPFFSLFGPSLPQNYKFCTTTGNLPPVDNNYYTTLLPPYTILIEWLIYVLKTGTDTSKQNAACGLLSLALVDEYKMSIGACGGIPSLFCLLVNGIDRGKKDAFTTLYKLCSVRLNKERAISADCSEAISRVTW